MPESAVPWITLVVSIPVLSALAMRFGVNERAMRPTSIALALVALAVSLGPIAELGARGVREIVDPWTGLAVDELSALLLPFASTLFVLTVGLQPRVECTSKALSTSALTHGVVLAFLLSRDALVLGSLWALLIAIPLWELRDGRHARAFALTLRYLGLSAVLVAGGAAAIAFGGKLDPRIVAAGIVLVAIGAMIRNGIAPLHSWLPELFEHGKLGPALLFSARQLAAYLVLRLVVPAAPGWLLATVTVLALLTAVYGAAAFVVQRDARRAFGYLFTSQSALVMVGLESTSVAGLVGGMSMWLSSGIALAGMGGTLWVLEARRGRLSIDRLHGGYEDKPLLAVSFLVLGLASVGFPGTLGFVAQELLIDAAVTRFPVVGFAVVVASSLSAIGVLRMYFALFCGKGVARVRTQLRPRELVVMASLVIALLALGLAPQGITAFEARIAESVIEDRAATRAELD